MKHLLRVSETSHALAELNTYTLVRIRAVDSDAVKAAGAGHYSRFVPGELEGPVPREVSDSISR